MNLMVEEYLGTERAAMGWDNGLSRNHLTFHNKFYALHIAI